MDTSRIYTTRLTEEHLDQAADVLARSFIQLNNIWKSSMPPYEQIVPFMRGRVLPTLSPNANGTFSYVLIKDKKVIGVAVNYELLSYIEMPDMPCDIELFVKLA